MNAEDRDAARARRDAVRGRFIGEVMQLIIKDADALDAALDAAEKERDALKAALQQIADGKPYSMPSLIEIAEAALGSSHG